MLIEYDLLTDLDEIEALSPEWEELLSRSHCNRAFSSVSWYLAACRAHAGLKNDAGVDEAIAHAKVRSAIALGLAKLKAQGGGSSTFATRAILLAEPASVDGGEITDKGYINQRAVLTRRAAALAKLDDDACAEWIGCGG